MTVLDKLKKFLGFIQCDRCEEWRGKLHLDEKTGSLFCETCQDFEMWNDFKPHNFSICSRCGLRDNDISLNDDNKVICDSCKTNLL